MLRKPLACGRRLKNAYDADYTPFNVGVDGQRIFFMHTETAASDQLTLKGGEEALAYRVVIVVTNPIMERTPISQQRFPNVREVY